MERAGLENLVWYHSGDSLGRCKYRTPVTERWDADTNRVRREGTKELLKKEENSLL